MNPTTYKIIKAATIGAWDELPDGNVNGDIDDASNCPSEKYFIEYVTNEGAGTTPEQMAVIRAYTDEFEDPAAVEDVEGVIRDTMPGWEEWRLPTCPECNIEVAVGTNFVDCHCNNKAGMNPDL